MTTFLIIYLSGVLTTLLLCPLVLYASFIHDDNWEYLTLASIIEWFDGVCWKSIIFVTLLSWIGFIVTTAVATMSFYKETKDDPEGLVYKILNYKIVKK